MQTQTEDDPWQLMNTNAKTFKDILYYASGTLKHFTLIATFTDCKWQVSAANRDQIAIQLVLKTFDILS